MSINKILDKDILAIKRTIEMMVEETKIQYASTYEVINSNNYDLAAEVIQNDKKINKLQNEFANTVLWKISKQHMVAGDLRLAVGSILISREIERIADYSKNICKFFINYKPSKEENELILKLFELVIKMLDAISHLINNYDKDEIEKVTALETAINKEFKSLFDVFFKKVRTAKRDEDALVSMNAIRQLKNLERAADHLVEVQEIVTFIRTGEFKEIIIEEVK